MSQQKRTAAATWTKLNALSADEDFAAVAAMSTAEVDAELRAGGIDADALRAGAAGMIAELRERHVRLGWQMAARAKLDHVRAVEETVRGKFSGLSRAELIDRITGAKADPRFKGQVGAMFRKRGAAESSDAELANLLEELEVVALLQEEEDTPK